MPRGTESPMIKYRRICRNCPAYPADVPYVESPPVASFTYTEDFLEVTFTDTSTNSPTSWFWDFGDGNTSTLQNPVHTYASAGAREVTLTATNADGSDDYFEEVEVEEESTNAVLVTPGSFYDQPEPYLAFAYDFAVWSGETDVTVQVQRSDDGVGGWANYGSSFVLGIGSLPTPTYADEGKYFRIQETANPGAVVMTSAASLITVIPPAQLFVVTTTGAGQTLTIQELRTVIGEAVEVNWGDGNTNSYTSTGSTGNNRTHVYAAAGSYAVTVDIPNRVTHFDIRDAKVTIVNGPEVSKLRNLTNFRVLSIPNTALQWTVNATNHSMPPLLQYIQIELQNSNFTWNVTASTPMPPINDVLNLRGLPGLTWTINSTTPLPPLVESLTIRDSAGVDYVESAENCLDLSTVRIESGWDTTMLDAFLLDVYAAFPSRTVSAGTIDLAGGSPANGVPSGTLAAMCPPTTGKAAAYELVNDSCGVSSNHWTSVTTS